MPFKTFDLNLNRLRSVSPNNKLFGDTVSPNNELFGDTVSPNNFFLFYFQLRSPGLNRKALKRNVALSNVKMFNGR